MTRPFGHTVAKEGDVQRETEKERLPQSKQLNSTVYQIAKFKYFETM